MVSVVKLKGSVGKEDILEAIGLVIILVLGLVALALNIAPFGLSMTEMGAFGAATGIAYSVSGLSVSDEGSLTRYLGGDYDIEIGVEKDSEGPFKNYYIKAASYRKGKAQKPIDKIVFIGNLKLSKDPLELKNVSYIKFEKPFGGPVEIEKVSKTQFSQIFCDEPSPEEIKKYIQWYSMDEEEEKWAKTIIMAESSYQHCTDPQEVAYGLMQLTASAAREVGISEGDRYYPEQNIEGGIKYFRSRLEIFDKYDDKYTLAVANYNCGMILTLVRENCEAKNVYNNCWEYRIKPLVVNDYCQGRYGHETYNYVERVQSCVKYYERNPDCYNVPGETEECPTSSGECG